MTCNSIDIRKRSAALNRAEQYRTLAEDVRTRAAKEPNPIVKAEWENLVQTYVRLAKQVDDGWKHRDHLRPAQGQLQPLVALKSSPVSA